MRKKSNARKKGAKKAVGKMKPVKQGKAEAVRAFQDALARSWRSMPRPKLGKHDLRSARRWANYVAKSTVPAREKMAARRGVVIGKEDIGVNRAIAVRIIVDQALKETGIKERMNPRQYRDLCGVARKWLHNLIAWKSDPAIVDALKSSKGSVRIRMDGEKVEFPEATPGTENFVDAMRRSNVLYRQKVLPLWREIEKRCGADAAEKFFQHVQGLEHTVKRIY